MTITTDVVQVKNGADYSFMCGKIPFAITCSSTLQHGNYNLIDLDIVNKMKIPLQKIKVCRMTYLGENLRSVGYIDQTIQCVKNGVIQGTVHLSAKVVRNLFDNFNVDCIASAKTYERLTGNKPPDPPDSDVKEDDQKEDTKDSLNNSEIFSSGSSSTCSDGQHGPITKEWLFKASLIASAAQQDDADTLVQIENEKAMNNEDESEDEDDSEEDSNTETDDEEDDECDWSGIPEMQCDLCFRMGQPVKIWTNHSNECPTCPTMTLPQKESMFGPEWKERAEKIIRKRFKKEQKREQKRRKGNARP